MKSYAADHERNIWNLGTGLFLSATTLTSLSCLLALNSLFDLPEYVNSALTVLLALCVGFAMAARTSMVDLWRTMEHNTRLAIVVFLGVFFVVASMAPANNSALAGLLALHVPAALTLVSEKGFARLYFLTGLTSAFSVLGWNPVAGTVALAVVALLLFGTLAYENFYMHVVGQAVSTRVNGWLPALLALWRYALFAGPAWLLWRFLPMPRPFLTQTATDSNLPSEPRITDPDAFNANLLQAFAYTMAMIILLLALIAMLRYLHSKLRRKRGDLLPESIGVPVGSPQRMKPEEKARRRERADEPLAQIVKEYERFSTALRSDLAHRAPSQTPQEFAVRLGNLAAVPPPLLANITSQFSMARYAPEEVTWETADQFSSLIDRAIRSDSDDVVS